MNLSTELTKQVSAHLNEVRKHLGNLPADERQEILQSIESHIYDALENRSSGNPTPELLKAVIAEMDPLESYGERVPAKNFGLTMKMFAVVLTVLLGVWIVFKISTKHTAEIKQHPVVISTFPASGENAVDPSTTELSVTFNQDMLTYWVWLLGIESTKVDTKFLSDEIKFIDKRTFITPVNLEPNKTYIIWINATHKKKASRDLCNDKNRSRSYRLKFSTGDLKSEI